MAPAKKRPFQFSLRMLVLITLMAGAIFLAVDKIRPGHSFNRERQTSISMLKIIELACENYENDWNAYPPDIGPTGQRSSSALIYYLRPYLDGVLLKVRTTSNGQSEFIDAWGNPFQYDNIRDDKSTPNGFTSCGADDIRTDGKPRNPKSFDLFSRGDPNKNEPIANFEVTK